MFHVYWPATACLTLFLIVGVIMVMLRWGPRICRTRNVALPERTDWQHRVYEQTVTYA
ncbi:uncharacterized protein LOC108907809 [Anoplophora glabripennis]|uniref:uncharacterized protein LOC108907809 n=1 Tax=Anoplophora glabripennis TaxID=217634 RepID=UPI000873F878|nr:uncharacterized protein LOC108907809 [Anoplophora glabripennis]